MRDGAFFDKTGSGRATRTGIRHAPSHKATHRLARGRTTRDAARLTFSEPGLYTIEVSANVDLSGVDLPAGTEYADGVQQTHWVWIGKDGRALDRPDLSAIPEGYVGTLGPARTPSEAPAFAPSAPSTANKLGSTAPFLVEYQQYRTNAFFTPSRRSCPYGAAVGPDLVGRDDGCRRDGVIYLLRRRHLRGLRRHRGRRQDQRPLRPQLAPLQRELHCARGSQSPVHP